MLLSIDTTQELSPLDLAVLHTLLGSDIRPGGTAPAKATPAKATPAKATPAKAEPEPEEESEDDEDLLGDTKPENDKPTIQDCVALATKLVSNGEGPAVKEALSSVGAKRVSEVSGVAKIKKLHDALLAI